jgi:hypothetical protein
MLLREKGKMLWQTNRIKLQRPRTKQRLRLLHLVPADQAADKAGMAATVDMAAVVDVAKAVQAVAAVDAVKVAARAARAAAPADLAAASGNFSARKKSASFVSRRWT